MRFFVLYLILGMLFTVMAVGQALYHDDNTQDIFNFTDNLDWEKYNEGIVDMREDNLSMNMSVSETNMVRLKNSVSRTIDGFGYVMLEMSKFGVEAGFRNPQYNYIFWTKVLFLMALLTILSMFVFVVPYIVIGVFLLFQMCYEKHKRKLKERSKL